MAGHVARLPDSLHTIFEDSCESCGVSAMSAQARLVFPGSRDHALCQGHFGSKPDLVVGRNRACSSLSLSG